MRLTSRRRYFLSLTLTLAGLAALLVLGWKVLQPDSAVAFSPATVPEQVVTESLPPDIVVSRLVATESNQSLNLTVRLMDGDEDMPLPDGFLFVSQVDPVQRMETIREFAGSTVVVDALRQGTVMLGAGSETGEFCLVRQDVQLLGDREVVLTLHRPSFVELQLHHEGQLIELDGDALMVHPDLPFLAEDLETRSIGSPMQNSPRVIPRTMESYLHRHGLPPAGDIDNPDGFLFDKQFLADFMTQPGIPWEYLWRSQLRWHAPIRDGIARFPRIPQGKDYVLLVWPVSATDLALEDLEITPGENHLVAEVDFANTIRGTVYLSGAPVQGAVVSTWGRTVVQKDCCERRTCSRGSHVDEDFTGSTSYTDHRGNFVVSVPRKQIRLRVNHRPPLESIDYGKSYSHYEQLDFDELGGVRSVEIHLPTNEVTPGGIVDALHIKVIDWNRRPVAGAEITLGAFSAWGYTDDSGWAHIFGLGGMTAQHLDWLSEEEKRRRPVSLSVSWTDSNHLRHYPAEKHWVSINDIQEAGGIMTIQLRRSEDPDK